MITLMKKCLSELLRFLYLTARLLYYPLDDLSYRDIKLKEAVLHFVTFCIV